MSAPTRALHAALSFNEKADHVWNYLRFCFSCMSRYDLGMPRKLNVVLLAIRHRAGLQCRRQTPRAWTRSATSSGFR